MIRFYPSEDPGLQEVKWLQPATTVIDRTYVDNLLGTKMNVSMNDIVDDWIEAAVVESEKSTRRFFLQRTATAYYKHITDVVYLPYPPHVSVSSVYIVDSQTGDETLAATSEYNVVGDDQKYITFSSHVGKQAKIVFTAGYASSVSGVPAWVKDAVSARVAAKYAKQPMEMGMFLRRVESVESMNRSWHG